MLITRLALDNIPTRWPIIRYSVMCAVPPTSGGSPTVYEHILKKLMTGEAQAWYIHDGKEVYSVMVTYINVDPITHNKFLVLYSFYSFRKLEPVFWNKVSEVLKEFGRNNLCDRIIAFTNVDKIIEHAEDVGWYTAYRVVMTEV